MEKAFAKWNSNTRGYRAIESGLGTEAFVDFSGGIPEQIDLENTTMSPDEIFRVVLEYAGYVWKI